VGSSRLACRHDRWRGLPCFIFKGEVMKTATWVTLSVIGIALTIVYFKTKKPSSPLCEEGYEDETGYHEGEKNERRRTRDKRRS
jgi:hypothetical protein